MLNIWHTLRNWTEDAFVNKISDTTHMQLFIDYIGVQWPNDVFLEIQ